MKNHLCLILLFLLTSCSVGPDYHTPVNQLPSHFSLTTKKISSNKENKKTQFWHSCINDPVLVDLINLALCGNNLDIQKSLANLRQARAELSISKANYFPQLDATGKISRDRLSSNSEILSAFPPGIIPLSYTDYNLQLDASWEIDIFGHTQRTVEASRALFQSNLENQRNVAIAVAAEVASTYTRYRVYQQQIIIAKRTIDSYDETAKLVKLQMKVGSATGVDLDRVESELLSAKAALPPLQAEAKATLASLAVLVGVMPEDLFKQLNSIIPIPVMNPKIIHVGLPSDLLQRRPDIKIAERNLAAANANIGVAVANQFPRFQLVGDLGTDTTIPGTYFNKASILWSAGPKVSIPIFEGGRLKNAVKAQEAMRDSALATYKQSVLQALADVESSVIRYDREREKEQKLLASYKKLNATLRLIKLQYQTGQSSLLDVLDAERQLNTLQDQYAQSEGQVTIDLISLYKALGGDWMMV